MEKINLNKEDNLIENRVKYYFEMFALPVVLVGGIILAFLAFYNSEADYKHGMSKKKMVHIKTEGQDQSEAKDNMHY